MSIEWKGVMPAVTTKFTNNDTLDLKTFEVNINAQLNAGVHGIVLGGTCPFTISTVVVIKVRRAGGSWNALT